MLRRIPILHYSIVPGGVLKGTIQVPGDKSISHRAIMLGALAEGSTLIRGFLPAEDCLGTLKAFQEMGVSISIDVSDPTQVHVQGVGLRGLKAPLASLDLGNSGTSIRLMAGLLAGQSFSVTLTGDESLQKRPMRRVIDPLKLMGAHIEDTDGKPPVTVHGEAQLKGITYALPIPSAQVKSAILLAGLLAEGKTTVIESAPTRDHTERLLTAFGYPISSHDKSVSLEGGHAFRGMEIQIPADISSAAFFMVGAAIAPDSNILLTGVGINGTRLGVIHILRAMGADIEIKNQRQYGAEPVADIAVRYSPLKGIEIPLEWVPLAIDEFPILFIAAACAKGKTLLRGAAELRVKETDRIATMVQGLERLGITASALPDGAIIEGGEFFGGEIDSHGDHRVAMAFSMAALRASGSIKIHHCEPVATSFPNFVAVASQAGLNIKEEK
ncbi:MAG: 3-phosphoshikimate 1-carboxyvinyltransferase [Proteobacteria bacterium]|nr:3-phosphoshikimate 1-carboxyvinyltransferase [Pseudomonadota bacterium]